MNTKTQKAPNYTPEMVAEMTAAYTAAPVAETVKALAAKLHKSEAAVRMKLVNLGIYVKAKEPGTTKTGEKVQKKDETADAIGRVLRLSEGEAESLAKANKTALAKIWKFVCESRPAEE